MAAKDAAKDYYAVLGVAPDAGADAIKKAYRRLARRHHPDVNQGPEAERAMREVNEAYAVLSDAERRAAYDAEREAGARGFGGFDGGSAFAGAAADDAFADFFGQLFGHVNGGRRGARATAGGERHAKVVLDIEDAWRGCERLLSLRLPQLDAEGRVRLAERTLAVKIPAGVRPGQVIRLAGQGGAPGADLLLEVAIAPHPRWRVAGTTLAADLALAPWEAALGAVVPFALPDGRELKVRVPPGAQPGQVLAVRGQGWPGRERGDLELTLAVVLPSGLEPRARRLWEQMAQALPDFDARRVAAADAERRQAA